MWGGGAAKDFLGFGRKKPKSNSRSLFYSAALSFPRRMLQTRGGVGMVSVGLGANATLIACKKT